MVPYRRMIARLTLGAVLKPKDSKWITLPVRILAREPIDVTVISPRLAQAIKRLAYSQEYMANPVADLTL